MLKSLLTQSLLATALAFIVLVSACSQLSFPTKKPETVRILQLNQLCPMQGCAEFSMEVYSDGGLRYTGKAYTPMMGTYAKKLTPGAMDTLLQLIQAASIWSIPESFPMANPTQPVFQVQVFESAHIKTVTGQALPPALTALVTALQQLGSDKGWVQVAAPNYGTPPGVLPNVLRIQLKPTINPEYWQGKYYEYGMQLVRMLPDASNLWTFRFDPSRISPLTLKEVIANDPDVLTVAFEKSKVK